jgi:hypothetical protein
MTSLSIGKMTGTARVVIMAALYSDGESAGLKTRLWAMVCRASYVSKHQYQFRHIEEQKRPGEKYSTGTISSAQVLVADSQEVPHQSLRR